jgi:hypothetical protein
MRKTVSAVSENCAKLIHHSGNATLVGLYAGHNWLRMRA